MKWLALLCVFSGCAPMVMVTREQRPALLLEAPVEVRAQETGVVILDALNLFSDSHWRVVHAAATVSAQLQAAGVAIAPNSESAKTHVTVAVREDRIVTDGGARVATVTVWLESNGVTLLTLEGAGRGAEMDGRLYTLAIEDAAMHVGAALQPTTEQDNFRVEKSDGLEDANEKLLDGDLPGAIAAYQARLGTHPADVAALLNLSTALFASGDLSGAVENARRAAAADTSALKINRQQFAEDLARRAQVTTRVVEFTTFGAKKKQ